MIKVYKYNGQTEDECRIKCIEELDVYTCDIITKSTEEDGVINMEAIKKKMLLTI